MDKPFTPLKSKTAAPPASASHAATSQAPQPTPKFSFSLKNTPTSHRGNPLTAKMRPKVLALGAVLVAMVSLLYGSTIRNMDQEDWGDVMVPEAVKDKRNESNTVGDVALAGAAEEAKAP